VRGGERGGEIGLRQHQGAAATMRCRGGGTYGQFAWCGPWLASCGVMEMLWVVDVVMDGWMEMSG
jgi:hypothetical protein